MKKYEVIESGVGAFPENQAIIAEALLSQPTANELLEDYHPKCHNKPGCLLVKLRRERTYRDQHYLDIWGCLTCGLHHECLRSGWEIGWFNGTESKKLK